MPTVLRNLKILEVSSVDRGAGEGVKIVLMKRDADTADDLKKEIAAKAVAEDLAAKAAAEVRGGSGEFIDLASIEVGKSDDIDLAAIA